MKTANLTLTHAEADFLIGCLLTRSGDFEKLGYHNLPPENGLLDRLQTVRRQANPFIQEEAAA